MFNPFCFSAVYNITNPFELIWFLLSFLGMSKIDLYKKIAVLEKRVESLESILNSRTLSALREEKWREFQSIIRLQDKYNSRKSLS